MRHLLDTSVAICLRDVDPNVIERFAALDATPLMSIVAGATLVTLNARDFRSVPGLTVEDWNG